MTTLGGVLGGDGGGGGGEACRGRVGLRGGRLWRTAGGVLATAPRMGWNGFRGGDGVAICGGGGRTGDGLIGDGIAGALGVPGGGRAGDGKANGGGGGLVGVGPA